MGCHGIEGYRNAYPSYRVPRLGGQKDEYIVTALTAYRDGKRPHPTMQAQGGSLTDRDIEDLAAYFQGDEAVLDTVTEDNIGGLDAAKACLACHGKGGEAVIPKPATLSGQQTSYLEHALAQYRDGTRGGTVMSAFAMQLSDADISNLAMFFGRQSGLTTPDKSE
jgi:cytochrome c553